MTKLQRPPQPILVLGGMAAGRAGQKHATKRPRQRKNDTPGYDVKRIRLDKQATYAKTLTAADIFLFAVVSDDNNAVHTNVAFAATTIFGTRIAHNFLTASTIPAAIANRLPGPGPIYLSQQLNFRAPVRPSTDCACLGQGQGRGYGAPEGGPGNTMPRGQHRCDRRRGHGNDNFFGETFGVKRHGRRSRLTRAAIDSFLVKACRCSGGFARTESSCGGGQRWRVVAGAGTALSEPGGGSVAHRGGRQDHWWDECVGPYLGT